MLRPPTVARQGCGSEGETVGVKSGSGSPDWLSNELPTGGARQSKIRGSYLAKLSIAQIGVPSWPAGDPGGAESVNIEPRKPTSISWSKASYCGVEL